MMSVGRWTCSIIQAMVAVLPEPGDPLQRLVAVAALDAVDQRGDGPGLVARGPERARRPRIRAWLSRGYPGGVTAQACARRSAAAASSQSHSLATSASSAARSPELSTT